MNHIADANKMVGEDHLRDATKMVSDTPRTTDRVVFIDGNPWVNAPFARGLERELNAANESFRKLNIHALDLAARIKRLEDAGDIMEWWCTDPQSIREWHEAKEVKL